ncbi:unnamed protein product [Ophioblennius macclurei]
MATVGGAAGAMSTDQLIQQAALLQWLVTQSDEDRGRLVALTGLQIGRELFNRLSGRKQIDAFKAECIQSIAEFLQKNPQASQAQISAEVQQNVLLFAARVKALESKPLF